MIRFERPARSGVLLAAALLLAACPESWQRRAKPPTSALWVGARSAPVEPTDLSRLKEFGIEELVATVAELDLAAPDGPLVRREELPELPSSVPVTLAVAGGWPGGDGEAAGARVAEAARRLRFELEGRGGLVTGLHFDLAEVASLASYAEFLKAVRGGLDRTLFLSASLSREWLERPDLEAVGRAVDFVVPFLYGQRIYEEEDARAWDFVELERNLRRLEELGTPYMLGVITLGTATHLSAGGTVKSRRTGLSLQQILWNRSLKLRPGFSLEGVNRRVYAVAAERPTRVGKWELKTGESIRVVRAATSDLEELGRLLGAWDLSRHLGQVYYRLPAPGEALSLSMENLMNALDPTPASPDLELDVQVQRRTGRGWLVRFSITNRNGEITELSLMDSNYLEARCLGGVFGQRVDSGDFYRFDLYRTNPGGEIERTFRRSDILRLHVPILEGQQTVTSGDVEVHVAGEPRLELSGQFLLPDGRNLTLGPQPWPET